jgi:hypothetical protein
MVRDIKTENVETGVRCTAFGILNFVYEMAAEAVLL